VRASPLPLHVRTLLRQNLKYGTPFTLCVSPPLVAGMHAQIHRAARDTWAWLGLALVNEDVARVILVEGKHASASAKRFEKGLKSACKVRIGV